MINFSDCLTDNFITTGDLNNLTDLAAFAKDRRSQVRCISMILLSAGNIGDGRAALLATFQMLSQAVVVSNVKKLP